MYMGFIQINRFFFKAPCVWRMATFGLKMRERRSISRGQSSASAQRCESAFPRSFAAISREMRAGLDPADSSTWTEARGKKKRKCLFPAVKLRRCCNMSASSPTPGGILFIYLFILVVVVDSRCWDGKHVRPPRRFHALQLRRLFSHIAERLRRAGSAGTGILTPPPTVRPFFTIPPSTFLFVTLRRRFLFFFPHFRPVPTLLTSLCE